MTCSEADALLSELLDDELSDDARAGIESHLASCEGCAGRYRALRRTVRFVRGHAAVDIAPGTDAAAEARLQRATMDDRYGKSPMEVLVEEAGEYLPRAESKQQRADRS